MFADNDLLERPWRYRIAAGVAVRPQFLVDVVRRSVGLAVLILGLASVLAILKMGRCEFDFAPQMQQSLAEGEPFVAQQPEDIAALQRGEWPKNAGMAKTAVVYMGCDVAFFHRDEMEAK